MLKVEFDCRPGAIATSLALREPNYQETAAYSHFGRKQYTKDGIKFFEWENEKKLTKYTTMDPAQVTFEIDSNGILNLGAEDKGTGNAEKITESTAQANDGRRPERRGINLASFLISWGVIAYTAAGGLSNSLGIIHPHCHYLPGVGDLRLHCLR